MTPPNVALYEWIRRGLDFRGRSSRSEYWWTRLLVFTVNFVLLYTFLGAIGEDMARLLLEWLENLEPGDPQPFATFPFRFDDLTSTAKFSLVFMFVFGLLTLIPDLSLSWRRYHDMNQPGWIHLFFLIGRSFVPFLFLIELAWFVMTGTRGTNRFGPERVYRG